MTTKGTDNRFRSLTVVGEPGTPATPASGDFKLYVADDGTLFLMDDTGTPTAVGGGTGDVATDAIWDAAGDLAIGTGANTAAKLAKGSAGGRLTMLNGAVTWDSGSSFPGSPASGDRFWRSDRHIDYYYDGTRWLSAQLFVHYLLQTPPATLTALSNDYTTPVWNGTDLWLDTAYGMLYTASGLGSSDYWKVDIYSAGTNPATPTLLASMNNQSGTNAQYARKTASIGALLGTSQHTFTCNFIKVGTPGACIGSAMITYRLVG